MPNYLFIYHGGGKPETEEEGNAMMAQWMAWFGDMGAAVVESGAPVGLSKTVSASGVADDGGANPTSGYSVVNAADIDAACAMAKGCPMVGDGSGSVEVAEIIEM
ncbi:hypothetical protein G5B38_10150 [Pseudohalocynthiibacter aestuariivivens]|uniref:YciI family protein n=1 Tax=Roseovarius pelagicus TaxID=2980108 RepID=A0ABY6D7S2_9RHOB|nr:MULTISPECIES: YciI family protein [Rhodobacterales]QIE45856.1 hypothetical protein G5B38_10150 [Pseudohalocynthiibacter aestuariivivens]UXX82187.1 YciI family protein [Roseovarius pelagicus]